jgi:hypothetical protein
VSSYFRDFVEPVKIIFDRLDKQKNPGVIINGQTGLSNKSIIPPYYPNLPEYPCKLVRGSDGKVTEIQYGKDNTAKGYVWRQLIHRRADGKVDYIQQENPDGSFHIAFQRDAQDRVEIVNVE